MSGEKHPGTLEMVREIRATPDRVFRALTDPGDLMQWWGKRMTKARVDLRPGGKYRFDFRGPDGRSVFVAGEYRIVEPPRRLVKTWFNSMFEGVENVVDFTLEPMPVGTRLTLRHSGLERDDLFRDYENGWVEVLGYLIGWVIAAAGIFAAPPGAEPKE